MYTRPSIPIDPGPEARIFRPPLEPLSTMPTQTLRVNVSCQFRFDTNWVEIDAIKLTGDECDAPSSSSSRMPSTCKYQTTTTDDGPTTEVGLITYDRLTTPDGLTTGDGSTAGLVAPTSLSGNQTSEETKQQTSAFPTTPIEISKSSTIPIDMITVASTASSNKIPTETAEMSSPTSDSPDVETVNTTEEFQPATVSKDGVSTDNDKLITNEDVSNPTTRPALNHEVSQANAAHDEYKISTDFSQHPDFLTTVSTLKTTQMPVDVCSATRKENCFNVTNASKQAINSKIENTDKILRGEHVSAVGKNVTKKAPKRIPANVSLFTQIFKDPDIAKKRAKYKHPVEAPLAPVIGTPYIASVVGMVVVVIMCDLPRLRRQLRRARANIRPLRRQKSKHKRNDANKSRMSAEKNNMNIDKEIEEIVGPSTSTSVRRMENTCISSIENESL